MSNKKNLGQYNTTKKDYILSGFENFVPSKEWIDPFAGNGDLIDWILTRGGSACGFDIDPSKLNLEKNIQVVDSLNTPIGYNNKWVIANPPYLRRGGAPDKTIFDKFQLDDLYKIAIKSILDCNGGILILPLNFLCAPMAEDIRHIFFEVFSIKKCTIFEETVFEDTDFTVCAFYFERRTEPTNKDIINVVFKPCLTEMTYNISKVNGWVLGEEFFEYIKGYNKNNTVCRWSTTNLTSNKPIESLAYSDELHITNFSRKFAAYYDPDALKDIIFVRSIDTGSNNGRVKLFDIRDMVQSGLPILLGDVNTRTFVHVKLVKKLTYDQQHQIIEFLNEKIEEFREKYHSIFLTSFRNSTKFYCRKRINFEDIYKLVDKAISLFQFNT